jgi:hypothetical protein
MGTIAATVQEGVAGRRQLRLVGPLTAVTAPAGLITTFPLSPGLGI